MKLTVNDETKTVSAEWQQESLLFVLREHFGLTGAKFGCGTGHCGACTVIVDGEAQRSCITSVSEVVAARITTIEGLERNGELHPAQQAWLDEAVPQCGYCQAGQIMTAVALLSEDPQPDDATIDEAMEGVLCRCGTHRRIHKAIKRAAGNMA